MKPMGLNSTRFLSYQDIKVDSVDIYEDAWGFNSDFFDVISVLRELKTEPGKLLTEKLIGKIRKQD